MLGRATLTAATRTAGRRGSPLFKASGFQHEGAVLPSSNLSPYRCSFDQSWSKLKFTRHFGSSAPWPASKMNTSSAAWPSGGENGQLQTCLAAGQGGSKSQELPPSSWLISPPLAGSALLAAAFVLHKTCNSQEAQCEASHKHVKTGLIFHCPECRKTNIQRGNVEDLPFAGKKGSCENENCKARLLFINPADKKVDTGVGIGLGATTLFLTFVCPPAAAVTALAAGGYHTSMGVAQESGKRVVRGAFAVVGAGADVIQAEGFGHAVDAVQAVFEIAAAFAEEDPFGAGLAIFCGVAVACDGVSYLNAADAAAKAKRLAGNTKEAEAAVSELARQIRRGGTVDGVKIGGKVFKNLNKATKARDGIRELYRQGVISAEASKALHETCCKLQECCGFQGDTIADLMEATVEIQQNVHVQTRW